MKQALLIVDVQPNFPISMEVLRGIRELSAMLPSVATVERHDESVTPFEAQLGWKPGKAEESLVPTNRVFIKHGYLPPPAAIEYLRGLRMDRILVCGTQADTCVLAAGFALFDAGLHPTLLKWLTVGSSLDRSGNLGARLWEHHFGSVLRHPDQLGLLEFAPVSTAGRLSGVNEFESAVNIGPCGFLQTTGCQPIVDISPSRSKSANLDRILKDRNPSGSDD